MLVASGIAWILAAAVAGPGATQGLGEAAAKEKKRREARKQTEAKEKTFTDEDLQKYAGENSGGASDTGLAPEDGGATSANPSVPTRLPKDPADDSKRSRAAVLKADLERCQASLAAARAAYKATEASEPSIEYPAGYPVSPTEARERVREIKDANLKAAKARVEQAERSCAALEDAARRENIPPGWIR